MAPPRRLRSCVSENLLTILTIAGVVGGVVLGTILKLTASEGYSAREIMYIKFPGEIFLNMLKGLILPLIVSSIVSAIGTLDLSLSGKIGMRSIYYYATTTVTAVALGILLVSTIRPGVSSGVSENLNATVGDANPTNIPIIDNTVENGTKRLDCSKEISRSSLTSDTLLDLVRNVFPPNIIEACVAQLRTKLTLPKDGIPSGPDKTPLNEYCISRELVTSTNTVGLVVFGIILGLTIGKMGKPGKPLLDVFVSLSDAMMIITNWVIWLSPLGVMFLVTGQVLEIDDFGALVGKLGLYFLTVLLGLFLHGFGTLSVIFFVCTRKLPFRAIAGMGQVMATAFGSASSSATLPITLQCLDDMGYNQKITRFVVPIGATINMDGTALYEAVAAIFIAQTLNVEMTFGKVLGVSITATAASIGAAGIPQAGLVTMVMVLDTIGLPADNVSIILAVDWLLDRFRTTINVMCDALGAIIIEHMSKGDLAALELSQQQDSIEMTQLRKDDA